jgi:glutamyl-tRNA reductase
MSVPRNVDPQVATVTGIKLHNFDDLAFIVKQNLAEREALTKDAEEIIFSALKDFEQRQQALMAVPVIAQLRGKVEDIRLAHLSRHNSAKRQSKHTVSKHINQQLDKVSRVLINEILHKPTTKLKAAKDYQSLQKQSEVLRCLFDLES